jgi:ATP diphosphatase
LRCWLCAKFVRFPLGLSSIAALHIRHLNCSDMSITTGERFERAVAIMARLRGEGGCPWDREQTFDSIQPYTLEETYEVLEAIDNRDWEGLPAELGDLLLQVLFYAQMARDEARFSIDDVLDRLSDKLVHRHPHVFGDVKADTSSQVLRNWEAIKAEEKKARKPEPGKDEEMSILSAVSTAMPALMEAHKLSSRASRVGFDWPNVEGLFDKLREETDELREELKQFPVPGPRPRGEPSSSQAQISEQLRERLEEEVGDLFFVLVNLARYLSVDSESALRKTNRKFRRRFRWIEERLRASGRSPEQAASEELEALWNEAKAQEGEKN